MSIPVNGYKRITPGNSGGLMNLMDNYQKINNWMKPDPPQNLFLYRPRRNNAS